MSKTKVEIDRLKERADLYIKKRKDFYQRKSVYTLVKKHLITLRSTK